ncbi:MAG: DJ-1/PfpI family protein [Bdellovibrionia bacterium]
MIGFLKKFYYGIILTIAFILSAGSALAEANTDTAKKTTKIAILLYDGMTTLDAIGPYEVLQFIPNTKILFVAKRAGRVETDSKALSLVAPYGFSDVKEADILIIPGSANSTFIAMADPEIIDWVKRIDKTTQYTTSVCSGSLILAKAGILEGKNATSHWAVTSVLSDFGAIPVTDQRVVTDGKVITAAGVSAGIDMALSLAARFSSEQDAKVSQLLIEYDPQPPFDSGSIQKASKETLDGAQKMLRTKSLTLKGVGAMIRLLGERVLEKTICYLADFSGLTQRAFC